MWLADLQSFLGNDCGFCRAQTNGSEIEHVQGGTLMDTVLERSLVVSAASERGCLLGKPKERAREQKRDSVSARWDGIADEKLSRGAAPSRGETKYNPSSLSAVPGAHQSRDFVIQSWCSRKPVSPEPIHGAARMFESDATRLSSS